MSAASLNNLALSTSAFADITLDSPILFYFATAAISFEISLCNYISFIKTLSQNTPLDF